ncbi:MAG: DNA-deoxyinosine glycosylase [Halioglobus sp.]|nr:DNA-deoxyinosine glycosylase [Halioglobus sp.]
MKTITSFAPIANKDCRILILGSIPGEISLQTGQYYAHPRNAFWRIMGSLFGFSAELPYEARIEALQKSGVAIWDVLQACVRSGSLDSAIAAGSRVPNAFQPFFNSHPKIEQVGFNGAEAKKSFMRYVLPTIDSRHLHFARLPSSSPAHAVKWEEKLAAWRQQLKL